MENFFVTSGGAWGDGSVRLTAAAVGMVVTVILLLLVTAALIRHKNTKDKAVLTTKQLVYSAAAIALAVTGSMIKLYEMPMGGSVTMMSMFFIVLIAYWYGPYVGVMTAVAYGLVQFVTEPVFYTLPQMLLDYPLAFGALGLAGFFHRKRYGFPIYCRGMRQVCIFHPFRLDFLCLLCAGRNASACIFSGLPGLLSDTGGAGDTDRGEYTVGGESAGICEDQGGIRLTHRMSGRAATDFGSVYRCFLEIPRWYKNPAGGSGL